MKQRNRQMSANLTGNVPFFYMVARYVASNRHKKNQCFGKFFDSQNAEEMATLRAIDGAEYYWRIAKQI
jgi:hypothetical protein